MDSKPIAFGLEGSSPSFSTNHKALPTRECFVMERNFSQCQELLSVKGQCQGLPLTHFKPHMYTTMQKAGNLKYTVRLSRDVEKFIQEIKLSKT